MPIKIYTASKTRHASIWIQLRKTGLNIISTWLNEFETGVGMNLKELAIQSIIEPTIADVTILYCEPEDYLSFALIEVGAALAHGRKIVVVGEGPSLSKLMAQHPNIYHVETIEDAVVFVRNLENVANIQLATQV